MNREEIRKKWKNRELAEISKNKLARQEETQNPNLYKQTFGLGNINLRNRPVVKNSDGSISTVRSMSFYDDDEKKEILVPTVVGGKIVSDREAIDNYYKTGQYLGKFDTPEDATDYALKLHDAQDKYYNKPNVQQTSINSSSWERVQNRVNQSTSTWDRVMSTANKIANTFNQRTQPYSKTNISVDIDKYKQMRNPETTQNNSLNNNTNVLNVLDKTMARNNYQPPSRPTEIVETPKQTFKIPKIDKLPEKTVSNEELENLSQMNDFERNKFLNKTNKNKKEVEKINNQVKNYIVSKNAQENAQKINSDISNGDYGSAIYHILSGLPREALNATTKTVGTVSSLRPGQENLANVTKAMTKGYQETTSQIENPLVRTGAQVTGAVGNMIPGIASNIVAPGSGIYVNAVNVGTSEYLSTLNEEQTNKLQAILTGVAKGAVSKKVEELAGGNIFSEGSFDDVALNGIAKIKSDAVRWLASKGYEVGGEVAEENIENLIGYAIDSIINNEDITAEQLASDFKETSKDTALTTLFLDALGLGGNTYRETTQGTINNIIEESNLSDAQKEVLTETAEKNGLSKKEVEYLIDNTKNGKYEQNQATTTPNNEILNQEQQTIQQEGKQAQNETLKQIEKNAQNKGKKYNETYSIDKNSYKNEAKQNTIRLYTNTKAENIDSILKDGLKIDKAKQKEYEGNMTWFETRPDLKGYGGTTIAVDVPVNLKMEKLNDTQYGVYEDISPENIVFIDKPIFNNYRTSDLENLVNKFGKDKVLEVFNKSKSQSITRAELEDMISNIEDGKQAQNQTSQEIEENKQEVIKKQEKIDTPTNKVNQKINELAEKVKNNKEILNNNIEKINNQLKNQELSYSQKQELYNVLDENEKQLQQMEDLEDKYNLKSYYEVAEEKSQDKGQYAKVDTEQQPEQPVEQTVKEEKPKKQIEIYNQYKKKIIERNEKAVNNLISYKNQTTTELDESIAKKEALLASKKNKNTKVANTLKMQIENLKARKAEIETLYNERIDKFNNKIDKKVEQEVQKQMKQNARKILEDEVVPLLEDSDNWVDKKAGIKYSTETAERNIEDIVKDKEKAQQIIDAIFQPIHEHDANTKRGAQENYDRINDLKLDKKKKYTYTEDDITYKVDEATLAQLLIEKKINENDLKEYGVDVEKIKNTAEVFKDILANYYDRMNETVVKYGYAPIGKVENYFPHFTENKPDTLLGKVAGLFGIDTTNQELPTEISGRTEQFKPGRVWNSNILKRLGNKTDYDALKVMERYILGAEDIINTTDDIQKLRQFSKALRYKYSEKAIQDTIESFENNNDLTVQEKEEAIENLLQSRSNKLHQLNHFATWLDDYTNILANKKNSGDREFEKNYNRSMYKNMSAIESRIAANTIGGNVSVSLTNFAPLFQAFGTTKASNLGTAIVENMRNGIFDIMGIPYTDYVQNSDFLTSRFGVDGISKKTALQKVENVLATPMEFADRISAETIVRAKYRENLASGMNEEEALKKADDYARRIMADRSKGALPVAFNNKNPISKLLTMYQVEPNNLLRNYFKDMPRNAQNSKQLAWQYMKLMGSSWAFNTLAMAIRGGNEVLPDPIRLATYMFKYFTSDDDKEKEQAGKDIQEAIFGILPFAQNIGGFLGLEDIGRVPISNAMPDITKLGDLFDKDVSEDYKKELLLKEFSKPVLYLGMPVRRCASR